jgi:hypothetical protein
MYVQACIRMSVTLKGMAGHRECGGSGWDRGNTIMILHVLCDKDMVAWGTSGSMVANDLEGELAMEGTVSHHQDHNDLNIHCTCVQYKAHQ